MCTSDFFHMGFFDMGFYLYVMSINSLTFYVRLITDYIYVTYIWSPVAHAVVSSD